MAKWLGGLASDRLLPVAVLTQSSLHCSSGGSPPTGGITQPRAGQVGTRLPLWGTPRAMASVYSEPGVEETGTETLPPYALG